MQFYFIPYLMFLRKLTAIVVKKNSDNHFNSIKFRDATIADLRFCELQKETAHLHFYACGGFLF